MSKRKHYSPEYKRELVELVRRTQSSCRKIALEVGVNPNMLTRWVREAEAGGGNSFPGGGTARDEEMARLKRELSKVTKERDFLKDAAAYFAKQLPSVNGKAFFLSCGKSDFPTRLRVVVIG